MFQKNKHTLISITFSFALALMLFAPFTARKAEALDLNKAIPGVGKEVVSAAASCLAGVGGALAVAKLKAKLDSATLSVPSSDENSFAGSVVGSTIKGYCLDAVAIQLSKLALKKFTESTVKWINTGFKGSPLYVKNPASFFKSIADDEVANLSISIQGAGSPFGKDLARNLLLSYKQTLDSSVKYNLDQLTGTNIENYNLNFSVGGWDTWLVQTQLPQNNPLGATFVASDYLSQKLSGTAQSKADELRDEISQGMGFMGIKKCAEPQGYEDPPQGWSLEEANGIIQNPNSDISDVTNALADVNRYVCTRWETQTPGNVIASKLNLDLGTGTRQAELSDQLNESVAAIFDALTSQLINKGLSTLDGGDASVEVAGNGGFGNNTSPGTVISTSNTAGQWYNSSSTPTMNYWSDIDPQITLENSYIDKFTTQRDVITNQLIPKIYELDYCTPGPRPDWYTGAQEIVRQSETSVSESYSVANALQFVYDYLDLTLSRGIVGEMPENNPSPFLMILNNTIDGYKQNIDNAWFSNNALLQLPTINSININEYKSLETHQNDVSSINDEITEARGVVAKLNYIKGQVASIPNPNQGNVLTPSQQDTVKQMDQVLAQIQPLFATPQVISATESKTSTLISKVQYIGNTSTGLIKECVTEFAQMSSNGLSNKMIRFPYPTNLLSPTIQAQYPAQAVTYSTVDQVSIHPYFWGGTTVKQERMGPSFAVPLLYYGYDSANQTQCPINPLADQIIHISQRFTLTQCANTAAFENLIQIY